MSKLLSEIAAQASTGGVFEFINLFSGGALTQMAVFALGIMPYITASIIMQLLTVVIPRLEAWSKEGESGTKKITQWTRYLTVVLAILQSTGIAFLFNRGGEQLGFPPGVQLIPDFTLGERVAHRVVPDRRYFASSCGWASSSRSVASATGCRF